jgi:lysyl-tRNA synthetase class 2
MSVRDMGKANFAVLQDSHRSYTGLRKAAMRYAPVKTRHMYATVWKKLLDIGDIIGVKGYAFITKTGETSIHVD